MTSVYCSVIFSVTCTLKKKGPQAGQGIFSALYYLPEPTRARAWMILMEPLAKSPDEQF